MEQCNFTNQTIKEQVHALNSHEIIYGDPGSGKTHVQMEEIRELVKQARDAHVIIVDLSGEFVNSDIGKEAQIVSISPDSNHCFNLFEIPEEDSFDLRMSELTFKEERVMAMLGIDGDISMVDDCVSLYGGVYESLINRNQVSNEEFCATMRDYNRKKHIETSEEFDTAVSNLLHLFEDCQEPFVEDEKRIIIYDLQKVQNCNDKLYSVYGVILDDIWNRVYRYSKNKEGTFLFLENVFNEAPEPLKSVLKTILKRARMHRLAISFATSYSLESNIVQFFANNSTRTVMLSCSYPRVRDQLKWIYRLDDEDLDYIQAQRVGYGLIR